LSFFVLVLILLTGVASAQPVADFTASVRSGCSPLSVQFTDLSSGNPTSFSWSFGNGNISTFQHPSAIYIVPGTYNVTLTVSNALGTDTEVKSTFITVFNSPLVDFTTNVTGGCVPLITPFNNTTTLGSAPIRTWLWDFGDGSIGSTQSPTHVYTIGGPKTISLTATDTNGCFATLTKNALVSPTQSHTADFSFNSALVCKGPSTQTFTPTVNPPASNYTYDWSTTNGLTSTQINPSFSFSNAGVYGVNLKVTAPSGCAAFVNKNTAIFIVNAQSEFDLPNAPYCSGQQFTFKNKSLPDTSVANFTWSVNNTNFSSNKDLITTLSQGSYTIKLVTDINGCKDSISKTLNVNQKPTANFTKQPSSICFVPIDVILSSSSVGNGLNHKWIFGNGDSSQQSVDTVTYVNLVNHNIKLEVTDLNGCKDSAEQTLNVITPTAQINAHNLKRGCRPFLGNFSVANAIDFNSFVWVYGSDTIGNTSSFNYTFTTIGRHVVKLIAQTLLGCRYETFDTIWVGDTVAFDFNADKFIGCFSQINPVTFALTENSGLSDLVFNWYWKNGTASGKNPVVNFTDTGLYNIRAVIDHYGCESNLEKIGFINIYPALARVLTPTVSCNKDSVNFDASGSSGANTFKWFFGDGDTANVVVVKHLYDSAGNYLVRLIATDTTTNCVDTADFGLFIPELPNLSFIVSDTLGCSPLVLSLTNTTSIGAYTSPIVSTNWQFSSGEITDGLIATDTLTTYGWKGLTMSITDDRGCVFSVYRDSVVQVPGFNSRVFFDKLGGCTPLAINGYDSSVADFSIKSRRWIWTPVDSVVTDTINTSSFIFTTPQTIQSDGYLVKIIIQDSLGCEFVSQQKIVPSKPAADIGLSRNISCGITQITSYIDTSQSKVLQPASYNWSLGLLNRNGSLINTTYNQIDTSFLYEVTVTDANGCTANSDTIISVRNKKPVPGFYANPRQRACYFPVLPMQLFDTTVLGSSGIKSRLWRFAANSSDQVNPIFTITLPGKYDVSLTITDSAGCVDSLIMPDYIDLGGPRGSYNYGPKIGCKPLAVEFQVSSPNAKYLIWDHGNGLVDTMEAATDTYIYKDAGVYYPRLTLYDSSGVCAYSFDAIDSIIVYDTPKPDFVTDTTKICFNTSLTFENITPNKDAVTAWKWRFNNEELNGEGPITKKFTTAGRYNISLIAIDSNGCSDTIVKTDTLIVYNDVIAPATPIVHRATVIDNTSNLFVFNASKEEDFYKYRVFYNYLGSSPQSSLDVLNVGDTFYLETGINTLDNPYSYAIQATDICGNTSPVSPTNTTVELKAWPIDNAIKLAWTPYKGFGAIRRYEIWRNNPDSGSTFYLIKNVSSGTIQYIDTSISCFTNYYYKIKTVAQDADTTKYSWSDTSGATPVYISSLPGTSIVRATVLNDRVVLLQWRKQSYEVSFKYLIYRMRDDELLANFYEEVSDTFFVDENVEVDEHSYSYFVYLKDACGGISLISNEAKTILLTVDLIKNDRGMYDPILHHTKYINWQNGVKNYELLFFYDSLGAYSKIATQSSTDTVYIHQYLTLGQRNYCYAVIASEQDGNLSSSQSNITCVGTEPRVYVPNVFTLNGDAINDKLVVGGLFIESFNMKIFDRWGTLVHESSDRNNAWDGNFEGKPMPSGVYVYTIDVIGRSKQKVSLTGSVTLIR
jgi:gliding motility-associated-like protein